MAGAPADLRRCLADDARTRQLLVGESVPTGATVAVCRDAGVAVVATVLGLIRYENGVDEMRLLSTSTAADAFFDDGELLLLAAVRGGEADGVCKRTVIYS